MTVKAVIVVEGSCPFLSQNQLIPNFKNRDYSDSDPTKDAHTKICINANVVWRTNIILELRLQYKITEFVIIDAK